MRDELWTRVEVALDARRSPFDDPELTARLCADPESERAVRRLLAGLARLGPVERAPHRRRAASRRGWAAAAAIVLGVGAWLARDEVRGQARDELASDPHYTLVVEHRRPAAPRCARVELAPRRVLAWRLEGESP